jgi:hypothetical protein
MMEMRTSYEKGEGGIGTHLFSKKCSGSLFFSTENAFSCDNDFCFIKVSVLRARLIFSRVAHLVLFEIYNCKGQRFTKKIIELLNMYIELPALLLRPT